MSILKEILWCFLFLHLHWVVFAGAAVLANKVFHLKDELFRKLLHLTSVFAIIPITLPATTPMASTAVCLIFMAEAWFGARASGLEKGLGMKQRRAGEQQQSMLLLFGTYALLNMVAWGGFHQKWMVILSVVSWGVGDCFAALIGKKFGKHKLRGKWIEGTKSIEGSVAMFLTSFLATFLMYRHHTMLVHVGFVVLVSFWVALIAALTELFSKNGADTFFCPMLSMCALIVLTLAAGGI